MSRGFASVPLPKGVFRVARARGRLQYYFQSGRGTKAKGPLVRLPDDPTRPEFWTAVHAAQNGPAPEPQDTVRVLVNKFRDPSTPEWQALSKASQKMYNACFEHILDSWASEPVANIKAKHIYALRDGMSHTPVMANQTVRILRVLLKRAIRFDMITANPATEVELLRIEESGAKPWPEGIYQAVLASGREDLVHLAVLGRGTGQRVSDLVNMRPADRLKNGISLKIQKRRGKEHWVPLLQSALVEIDGWKVERLVPYIVKPTGKRHDPDSIADRLRAWLASDDAGEHKGAKVTIHGLRATAVCDRRVAGLEHQQIAAQLGMSLPMVMRYSRFVDQQALANAGMERLEQAQNIALKQPVANIETAKS